jgi:hypothetical protein
MKELLSKVFFVSDCAKGAAFALTLFLVGNWLWSGVWHLLWLYRGKLANSEEWWAGLIGGFLLIALCAAVQLMFGGMCRCKILQFSHKRR